jgi:hypothetical protein
MIKKSKDYALMKTKMVKFLVLVSWLISSPQRLMMPLRLLPKQGRGKKIQEVNLSRRRAS